MRSGLTISDTESEETNSVVIGARNGRKRIRVNAELDEEGRKCQREAQAAIFKGQ